MKTRTFLVTALLASFVLSASADGFRVSILGDSYSTFEGSIPEGNAIWYFKPPKARNGVESPEQTWWGQTIALVGGTLEKNESWSGSTICYTGYNKSNAKKSSFVTRVPRLGNPNLILVCGATNDSWANSPIGEYKYENWTEDDLFTFRPAMAKMLADLKATYPGAAVFFLLNDILKPEINDSVHEICRHYAVPCVDLKGITKQGGHPDLAGMTAMAEQTAKLVLLASNATIDKTPKAPVPEAAE